MSTTSNQPVNSTSFDANSSENHRKWSLELCNATDWAEDRIPSEEHNSPRGCSDDLTRDDLAYKWFAFSKAAGNCSPEEVLNNPNRMAKLLSEFANPHSVAEDCKAALGIYMNADLTRTLLEARLLNRQSEEAIAARMNLRIKTIQIYHYLFYNCQQFLGSSRLENWYLQSLEPFFCKSTQDVDERLKRLAYSCSIDLFEKLLQHLLSTKPNLNQDWANIPREEVRKVFKWITFQYILLKKTFFRQTMEEKSLYFRALSKYWVLRTYQYASPYCVAKLIEEFDTEDETEGEPKEKAIRSIKKNLEQLKLAKSHPNPDLDEFAMLADLYLKLDQILMDSRTPTMRNRL